MAYALHFPRFPHPQTSIPRWSVVAVGGPQLRPAGHPPHDIAAVMRDFAVMVLAVLVALVIAAFLTVLLLWGYADASRSPSPLVQDAPVAMGS